MEKDETSVSFFFSRKFKNNSLQYNYSLIIYKNQFLNTKS